MSKIHYKLSFLDGQELSGESEEIYFKDSQSILTLRPQAAPVISLLSHGTLFIKANGQVQEFSYKEGFVKSAQDNCVVTILKY